MTNPLRDLNKQGQSVWYDNLNRELIATGALQRMVDEDGVSGGTSNPSIFEKAVAGSDAYDEHLRRLVDAGRSLEEVYDELTVTDVQQSADLFRPAYDRTAAADGYASLEVSPLIANETQASIDAAKRLFAALDRPNAMIKIPGTPEGLPAIERCLADGLNINITLLFGVENYEQVAWAYVSALEKRWAAGEPIDRIGSVASFFVSRVDTMIDEKLNRMLERATSEDEREQLRDLLGKAAVANAKIAYAKYNEIFSSPRWLVLAEAGAKVQRCLWASTSTKNPEYRDVIYVEPLIGPDTINTMPQTTLDAFRDHGVVKRTLEEGIDEAFATVQKLKAIGIDLTAVTDELQVQGVKLFSDSFAKVNESLKQKMDALVSQRAGARP
jgi:transaldolase